MENKNITITNGVGTSPVTNGTYSVTGEVTGYDNSSLNPSTITIENNVNTYSFTISATGTLNLHVTDTGEENGTPIEGAIIYRTSSDGTTYGNAVTTNSEGIATLNNVPFDTTNPPTIYYKQTTSDLEHTFDDTVKSITLTTETSTIEIENPTAAIRTFNLTDANYENLPIETASITIE